MPEIRIQPRDVYEHYVYVKRPGTMLQWIFSTKKKNISFGLFFRAGPPMAATPTLSSLSPLASDDTVCLASPGASKLLQQRKASLPLISTQRKSISFDNGEDEEHPFMSAQISPISVNFPENAVDGLDTRRSSMFIPSTLTSHIGPNETNNTRRRKSMASMNLIDKDFLEIIPIGHVNSGSQPVVGSYTAENPGNYVLIFDNTFSRNTSKTLTFSVSTDEDQTEEDGKKEPCDMSGWLLKKRRKRMQGWARRWFELLPSGILTYSVSPNEIKRGSIQIMLSTIAVYPKQRTIHVDSGTTIYHLKALTSESFEEWIDCFRKRRAISSNIHPDTGILVDGSWLLADSAVATPSCLSADDYDIQRTIMAQGLDKLSEEISILNDSLQELKVALGVKTCEGHTGLPGLITPTTSPSKKRFPFKRGSSNLSSPIPNNNGRAVDHLQTDQILQQHMACEKLTISVKRLYEARDQICKSFESQKRHLLNNPSSTSDSHLKSSDSNPGSHRSPSFYSYRTSVQSDTFYDAEDFVLSGDEEDDEDAMITHDFPESDDEYEQPSIALVEKPMPRSASTVTTCQQVSRRSILPHPVAGHSVSPLSILRKHIGKDLSTIAMPISLNEPLNLLQRLCEELEYSELLDKASTLDTSMDRLMYVAVFAVSGYASSQYRIGRKLFNPLMSETYECIRPDKGFRFISEKVSHSPNIMACHADSKSFQFKQTSQGKTKFWGKSMELISEGVVRITLSGHSDDFTYNKPSSWIRNMIAGSKYLEHVGEMRVTNHATGEYAVATFKESTGGGFFGGISTERNSVVIHFYSKDGVKAREIIGKWSDSLSEVTGKDQYVVLWRAVPPEIEDHQKYYGFTKFCMELNEITELELNKLPPTDTRYRPDQRMFENGEVDAADEEKLRIEQLQRERRRKFEAEGKPWTPLWFELRSDTTVPSGVSWQYKGGYWEARSSGQWPDKMLQLW
ncbi:hypothetical protein EC973_004264 [Apophysomyces ossiformis]|uniref:PH domain-containing protein n=1 Tax=Apophysomyces ossiformis TaxID=679940 RepID=A0A8H7BKG5_9FUNG|nr:hypothetical protein EC973_004264 [Apophysomyces ossiformis]